MNATDPAAQWFIAQRTGELSPDERERFTLWLNDSAANVREYLAIAELWGELSAAPSVEADDVSSLRLALGADTTVEMLPTRHADPSLQAPSAANETSSRKFIFAVAASVLVCAGTAAFWWVNSFNPSELRTGRGEQRSLELADGSVLQINALSHVLVHYDDDVRRVELRAGEALFRVAKDSARPFEVTTPEATVQVLGTTFNVQHRGAETRVAVVEGKVQVRSAMAASVPLPMGPNESAAVRRHDAEIKAASVESRKVTAWTQRRLIFDEEPLAQVVEEFNLYNEVQMTVADEALAQFHINGIFDADDPSALTAYLERVRGVVVERKNSGIRLRSANPH